MSSKLREILQFEKAISHENEIDLEPERSGSCNTDHFNSSFCLIRTIAISYETISICASKRCGCKSSVLQYEAKCLG